MKFGNLKTNKSVNKQRFQRLVGKLIYLSHTRPDISFTLSYVSQFIHAPTEEHMTEIIRVLRYLQGYPIKGLFFKKTSNRTIETFTDANWVGLVIDRRST